MVKVEVPDRRTAALRAAACRVRIERPSAKKMLIISSDVLRLGERSESRGPGLCQCPWMGADENGNLIEH